MSNSAPCSNCESGKYSTGTSPSVCLQCPEKTWTAASKSPSLQSCLCAPGYAGPPGGPCFQCPFGIYSTTLGSSSCLECAAGTYYSLPNVSAVATVDNFCRVCPLFSWSLPGSLSVQACTCNAGYIQQDRSDGYRSCTACRPGSYATPGTQTCLMCSVGKYSDSEGASSCKMCPAYQTNLLNGSRAVSDCVCGCGYYFGQSNPSSSGTCAACPAGQYKEGLDGAASDCKQCPADMYSENQGACFCSKQCPPDSNSGLIAAGAFCTCNSGFGAVSWTGNYHNISCSPCAVGYYRSEYDQMPSCRQCLKGFYNPYVSQSSCLVCPVGKSTVTTGSVNDSLCECDAGYYCGNANCSFCLPCPSGSYKSSIGLQNCTFCDTQEPTLNYYGQISSDACRLPDPPTVGKPTGGGYVFVITCPPGQERDIENPTRCQLCPTGKYKPQSGDTYFYDSFPCLCCPENTYQPLLGQTSAASCLPCPERSQTYGSICNPSVSQCLCMAGLYNVNYFPWCSDCPTGSYSVDVGATVCTLCGSGKFQNKSGSTSCVQCPPGRDTWSLLNGLGVRKQGSVLISDCKCNSGYSSNDAKSCIDCMPGLYRESSVSFSCVACEIGKYSSAPAAVSSATCKQCFLGSTTISTGANNSDLCICNAGWYQSQSGLCLQCSPGNYKSMVGPQMCVQCGAGKYQLYPGSTSCTLCPENSISFVVANNDPSSCYCKAGYESKAGICAACNVGKYKVTISNTEQCKVCPLGTYTILAGSTVPESCVSCPNNTVPFALIDSVSGIYTGQTCTCQESFYRADQDCQLCPIGTYKDKTGDDPCIPCGVDYYGTESGSNSPSQCQPCPEGTWTEGNLVNALASSCVCKPGFSSDGSSSKCTSCISGSYKNLSGSEPCNLCPLGTYSFSTRAGISACSRCPPNSVTLSEGQSSRNGCLCAPGFTGWNGGPCMPCEVGDYKDSVGSDGCMPCPRGTYGTVTGTTSKGRCSLCTQSTTTLTVGQTNLSSCFCNAGYYSLTLQVCIECPAGKFKNSAGNFACQDCQNGLYSLLSARTSDSCQFCPAKSTTFGSGKNSSKYCACETGFSNFNSSGALPICQVCPFQTFFSITLNACTSCDAGKYWFFNGTAFSCRTLLCPPDRVASGQRCLCRPGYYSSVSDISCLQCSLGTYSSSPGSSVCELCAVGTYSNSTGRSKCLHCPAGFSTAKPGSDSAASCVCGEGFGMIDSHGVATCIACPKGSYKQHIGNQSCLLCPVGTFSEDSGLSCCTDCNLYSTTTTTGSISMGMCLCNPGYYLDIESGDCLPCPVSTFKQGYGSGPCSACPNTFTTDSAAAASLDSCKICSAVPCSNAECHVRCKQCRACLPFYEYPLVMCNNTADSVCSPCKSCTPGQYPVSGCSATKGVTCECCRMGKYSALGATTCISCAMGKYSTSPCSTSCRSCDSGTYQSGTGMTAESNCKPCKAGKFSTVSGRSSESDCISCPAGTFSENQTSTACLLCTPGKYLSMSGKSHCIDCSLGMYQTFYGQKSSSDCIGCSAGHFLEYYPVFTCAACSPGTFQTGNGMASLLDCISCSPGTYQSFDAATSGEACIECEPGKYLSSSGSSSASNCLACTAGKYSTVVGAPSEYSCKCCESVSLEPKSAATICTTCELPFEPCRFNNSEEG